LDRLADDETVVEQGISDVADQWDERYKELALRSKSGQSGGVNGDG